ncbi:hypothetical protein MNEG_12789 [Monoraphidium neglectum]|uniref:Uncharacterized protein n=1 Tax=Monoraphidium neglectum TaxID=145388 RepID=A0A0D2LU41_9CHLO|nr:hypothetical protein MNEG_12789 [Monoraphidium neglectum]KIY95174.1 hypothetical protein MNEG_12789 [Monoraphidium neglectum]|eukprot:XP_013894194.1 hypothetical protein MNEG_12789 [Monoraphidium neglectum]
MVLTFRIAPGLWYGAVLPVRTYLITNSMMIFIYALQIMWFRKILKIAAGQKNVDSRVTVYHSTPSATPLILSPRPSYKEG